MKIANTIIFILNFLFLFSCKNMGTTDTPLKKFHSTFDKNLFPDLPDSSLWKFGIHAKKDDKWGVLSGNGEWRIIPEYEGLQPPARTLKQIPAMKNGKYGVINIRNEVIYPFTLTNPSDAEIKAHAPSGLPLTELRKKFPDAGSIRRNQCLYNIYFTSLNEYTTKADYLVTRGDGDILLKFQNTNVCYEMGSFHKGLALFFVYNCNFGHSNPATTGKYGYIDTSGNMVIEPQFPAGNIGGQNYSPLFFSGRALVKQNDAAYYYIDRKGHKILPREGTYSYAYPFDDYGYAMASTTGMMRGGGSYPTVIDTLGNEVLKDYEGFQPGIKGNLHSGPLENGYFLLYNRETGEQLVLDRELEKTYSFNAKEESIESFDFFSSDSFFTLISKDPENPVNKRVKFVGFSGKEHTGWLQVPTNAKMDI